MRYDADTYGSDNVSFAASTVDEQRKEISDLCVSPVLIDH
jgi:hypothetical protein